MQPRSSENVGAVARVCANMGLGQLRLVNAQRLDPAAMLRLAANIGRPWLDNMACYFDLPSALGDCLLAAGATARMGKERGKPCSPRQAAPKLLQTALTGKAALVFGPEDRGLDNASLDLCSLTLQIPTSELSSLNLAQAVMVLAYELRVQAAAQGTNFELAKRGPSMREQMALYQHLQDAFVSAKVINPQNPEHFMRPYLSSLKRANLNSLEIRAWRGVARKILWLSRQNRTPYCNG
jgi:tRNA/rRNA methyltransferase